MTRITDTDAPDLDGGVIFVYGVRVRVVDTNGGVHWGRWYDFVSDDDTKTHSNDYRDRQVEKYDNVDNTD